VTNEPNDTRQLHPIAKAAGETLDVERLTVVADASYSNGAGAAACEADDITACAPANRTVNSHGNGSMFDRSAFAYQPEADVYVCPNGRALARKQLMRRDRLILYAASDCSDCPLKSRCRTAERRFVTRHLHEEALERMNALVKADPSLIRQRRCAAEHPFGTITHDRRRPVPNPRAQKSRRRSSPQRPGYNIIRATNLAGARALRARLA
jgi:hypothetical protein